MGDNKRPAGPRVGGATAVLLASALFATGGAAVKATALSPGWIASGRSLTAAVVLWLALPAWRGWFSRDALLVGIPYGATLVLFVAATKNTTAVNAILLQSTAPIYAMAFAALWLGERARRVDLGWASVAAVGLVVFFFGRESAQATAPDPAFGNALGALAGISWALTLVGLRWLTARETAQPNRDSSGAAVIAGNVWAVALSLPWLDAPVGVGPGDLAVLVYLGTIQTGLAYVFLVRGLRRVPVAAAALLLVAEPAFNAAFTWLVHGEQPSARALAGGALILGAAIGRARAAEGASADRRR